MPFDFSPCRFECLTLGPVDPAYETIQDSSIFTTMAFSDTVTTVIARDFLCTKPFLCQFDHAGVLSAISPCWATTFVSGASPFSFFSKAAC